MRNLLFCLALLLACVTTVFSQNSTPGVVALQWNAYPETSLYEVYRGTNGNFIDAIAIATNSASATNFLDDTALHDVSYSYWVVAKDSAGNSQEVARLEGSQREKLWEFRANGAVNGSAAIGPDGTIYIATSGSTTFGSSIAPGKIVALTTNGAVRWELGGTRGFMSTPAVSEAGNIYAINADGDAYAITPGGTLKWKRKISRSTNTRLWRLSPSITGDSLIILPTTNGITALDEEGAVVWAHKVICSDPVSAVIGTDGTVYMSPGNQQLFALSRMGRLKWTYPKQELFGTTINQPVLLPDESVLFSHPYFDRNVLLRLSSGGVTNGQIVSDLIMGTPVVHGAGTILVPTRSRMGPHQVFITSFGGSTISNTIANLSYEPFALSKSDTLFVSGVQGNVVGPVLYSLFPTGQTRTNLYGRGNLGPSTFHPSGMLLVGSSAGRLYAVAASEALPTVGWPTARFDLRQSGNLSDPSPIPATPSGFTASVDEFVNQVHLNWADSDEFRYVEVWRSATTNFHDAVQIATNVTEIAYLDRSPPEGTSYYFLRAGNSAGVSEVSAAVAGSPNPDAKLRWQAQLQGVAGIPSLGSRKEIYVPVSNRSVLGYETGGFYSWTLTNVSYTADTPVALGADGRLHTWDGSAWVTFGTDGTLLDRVPAGAVGGGDLSVALDGTAYLNRTELTAYSHNGGVKWQARSAPNVAAAIDAAGNVYVPARNSFEPARSVEAYSPGGSNLWSYSSSTTVESVVIRDQGILVGSGSLTALNFDGELQWSTNLVVLREPIVGTDGTIFIASTGTNFYALNADGQVKWSYPTRSWGALVSREGNVYINVIGGVLALSAEGQKLWSYVQANTVSPSVGLALSHDGWLYFSVGNFLTALTTPDHPSEYTWSTRRGNMQRTGQLLQPMLVDLLSFEIGPLGSNGVRLKGSIRVPVVIETSEDLVNWVEAGRSDGGNEEIRVEFPPEANHAFVRLRATEPEDPPFEPLSDAFDDYIQDTEKWFKGTLSMYNGAILTDLSVPVNEVNINNNGKLEIQLMADQWGFHYNGYVSEKYYDFTGAQLTVEISQTPNPSTVAEMFFSVGANGANLYRFYLFNGQLRADTIFQGENILQSLGAYSANDQRYLRIRHDVGENRIHWEASRDRVQWSTLHSRTREFSIRSTRVELAGGTYVSIPAPGVAIFDDMDLSKTHHPQ